ncbi:hypothetical protein [Pelagicoccus sp. SDUM812003]|uniref:hypothetical protein n=1 Tax=Pelagicoccus sp. SDUM812003 TaxID=3041267 RepID=UPI00280F989C|nr:hypothetical protein [Pelagicoccus sp. SDUM812003]MDQ8205828.1 hypothetical protein [Pelagicoccus sp. SDUM812003]
MKPRQLLSSLLTLIAFAISGNLFASEPPNDLNESFRAIEKAIIENDQESSIEYVDYALLRSNWHKRWWTLFGRSKIPTDEEIKADMSLWNAGTVVKLSLEQYCDSIQGVRLLLHGGVSPNDLKERDEFGDIQNSTITDDQAKIETLGDDGKPVVSIFEKREKNWVLVDVILELK